MIPIESFIGKHDGETIAVVGNGPSLVDQKLDHLVDMTTIGVNRAYMLPDYNPTIPNDWSPTYAAWTDHERIDWPVDVYERCRATFVWENEIEQAVTKPKEWPNLSTWRERRIEKTDNHIVPIKRSVYDGIIQPGATAISAVHIAFMMGAVSVHVYGCDHALDDNGFSHFYSDRPVENTESMKEIRNQLLNMLASWQMVASIWPGKVVDKSTFGGLGERYGTV